MGEYGKGTSDSRDAKGTLCWTNEPACLQRSNGDFERKKAILFDGWMDEELGNEEKRMKKGETGVRKFEAINKEAAFMFREDFRV